MRVAAAVAVAVFAGALSAQVASPAPQPKPLAGSIASGPAWPAAKNVADVDTVDHLVGALYDVISGPAGKPRDWERFRSLFVPDGRMGVIRPDAAPTANQPARKGDVILLTPDIYVERDTPYFAANGFFERGVAMRTEEFGNLVSVWTTYESRHALTDAQPFARGINSLQLAHAQGRYWIVNILWDDERQGLVLPEKYLKGK